MTPEALSALYAEYRCLRLDLKYREQELARVQAQAIEAAEAANRAERQREHLQRRIEALNRAIQQLRDTPLRNTA